MPEINLPDVELNIHTPKDPIEATVTENYIVTRESSPNIVRHMSFDVSGTDLEGRMRVGQAFGILPPGENERGRPYKLRLYSLSCPSTGEDGEGKIVSTTVKRVVEEVDNHKLYLGVCSNYMCDLEVGDRVRMTGPSGRRFLLPENYEEFNYVFFAAGTGIAPFRGMVMELLDKGLENEMALIFGCPYRTDLLYADFFEDLDEKNKNFHYLKAISREDRRPNGSKKYVQSKLVDDADLLKPIVEKDNTLIYICGLKGMETGIYKELAKHGLMDDYLEVKDELKDKDPEDWSWEDLKKKVKPGERMFVEVY